MVCGRADDPESRVINVINSVLLTSVTDYCRNTISFIFMWMFSYLSGNVLSSRKAKREKENRWQENIRREEEEKKKRLEEERMQEKVQEKLKAEEAAAMMRERENKQQLLAEEEKNRQATISREVEQQRQRQLEEDKRKQEQIAKEAEERRKQNEEIKKTKEATNSQEVEKHTSKININDKFADLLKPTEGKSLKPPWKNEGNLKIIRLLDFYFPDCSFTLQVYCY